MRGHLFKCNSGVNVSYFDIVALAPYLKFHISKVCLKGRSNEKTEIFVKYQGCV